MDWEKLTIFMQTGRTFTFKEIEILADNESVISFNYSAMSDGLTKTATFSKNIIAGHSVTETEDFEEEDIT